MATTTVRITINSPDLTADTVSIVKEFQLQTPAGQGIQLTSGLSRKLLGTNSIRIHEGAGVVDEAYIFIFNPSTTKTVQIYIISDTVRIGVLQGGDSAFIPFDQTKDLKLTASAAETFVEYQIFRA